MEGIVLESTREKFEDVVFLGYVFNQTKNGFIVTEKEFLFKRKPTGEYINLRIEEMWNGWCFSHRFVVETLKREISDLKAKIEQHRFALGYSTSVSIPEDPLIKNLIADLLRRELIERELEITRMKIKVS